SGYGLQSMAVMSVRPGKHGKVYLNVDESSLDTGRVPDCLRQIMKRSSLSIPDEPLEANPRSFDVQRYGFTTWRQVFTDRQLATHLAVTEQLHHANQL